MIMRLKERRGRETLSSLSSSSSSRKKERERERERERVQHLCGEITSDCNGTRVAKDDERRSSESKRNRGKE